MLELKRILWNRKTLLLFGVLILLHGVFFFFQCNDTKSSTLTGEALDAYVEQFPSYVQSVQDNVTAMKENPLFNDYDSFVYRNLIKTGEDYKVLLEVQPVVGENRGIITVLNFSLTSFILLLGGMYIVLGFLAERQKGLYLLVRSTKWGRTRLSLQRIGILCVGIFSIGVLLYGSILCLSSFAFPGCDMGRPIQSIPEFESVIGHYSIGQYLVLFVLRKMLGCLATCLLLYLCMSVFRSSFCVVVFFLLFLGEYLLYTLIIPTAKWCVLKYINIYTYVFCGTEYAHYYNLNLFERPFNTVQSSDVLVLICALVFGTLCVLQYARQYPKGENKTLPFVENIRKFISRHKPSLSLTGWEIKKVLFSQKGIIVIVLMCYLSYSMSTESNYLDFRSKYVSHWYEEFAGVMNEERMEMILDKKQEIEDDIARWERSLAQQREFLAKRYAAGIFEGNDMIQGGIAKLEDAIAEAKRELTGLAVVIEQAEIGLAYYKETGLEIMLMDAGVYELLLHNDKQTIMRNHLYTLLTVVLVMSGIMACEKSSNMEMTLHTAYKGRMPALLRKIGIMIGVCVVTAITIHIVQYIQIGKVFEYIHKDALIQSVPCVRGFQIPLTIGQYLVFLFGMRIFIAVAMGTVVMWLSKRFTRITTLALGVFLLIIPMGLVAMRF